MPVLVTGAETGLGRATAAALRGAGGEVRAYLDAEVVGDADAEAYRRMGCKVALGEIDDEGRLELAMEQVHTVVHCWGGPLVAPDAELDGLAGALSAALGAGCRRFVWPSHLGAGDPGDVAYLAACAEAEALLADATLETIVLRRSLTYGIDDDLTSRLGGPALPAAARHAPLWMGDLAAAIARADLLDRSRVSSDLSLVVELAGPDVLPLGEIAAALRRSGRAAAAPLPPSTVQLYARDLVPGPDTLGRDGTPFARGAALLR